MKFKIKSPYTGDIRSKLRFAFNWQTVEGYDVILGFYYENYYYSTAGNWARMQNTFKKRKENIYDF